MTKYLRASLFLLLNLSTLTVIAQFPYFESFKNSTASGINFGGAPSAFLTAGGSAYNLAGLAHTGTPIDDNGKGYLRLTSNSRNQKGFIYSNTVFPFTQGLTVQFEYYIYGGSGADGISFFLFDATANPFNIGGFGGSLGYAQITTTDPVSPGVSKGYMAVGLDEFGNFSNPSEGRQGGPGQIAGSVTLRGKGDGAALTAGNYSFLTSTNTNTLGFNLVGDLNNRQPDSTSNGYRRVLIDLTPNPNGGYNITVRITRGGPTLVTSTVINNFYYPEVAPTNLKYGLASSTGDQTNFHEIRNVIIDSKAVSTLTPPVATNDVFTICQGIIASVDVAANDRTTNAGGSINRASIDLNPAEVGLQNSFTVAGKGVFSIGEENTILFSPETNFSGAVTASYNIKDTFGMTSNNATVTLTYTAAPVQPVAGADQLLNISTATTNYQFQGNNPGSDVGSWTQVSGPTTAAIVNPSLYNSAVNNLTNGVYTFRWTIKSTGGCELTDDVQIVVNHFPVTLNDDLTTNFNTSGTVLILNNDTDVDGNNTIDKASIVIKTQPQSGKLTIDPITGLITYTPNPGFEGADFFTYTVKDNFGAESNEATVNIIVNPQPDPTTIGLAKALTSRTRNLDGSYDLTYTFNLINFGDVETIYNISLIDDLEATFKKNAVIVKRVTATGTLNVDNNYNGYLLNNMLLPSSYLAAARKEQVILEINVTLNQGEGIFNNTALTEGLNTRDGSPVSDQSTDGLVPDPNNAGDVSPALPTPVNLNVEDLFIPGGFSPNNDGINDYFVIENGSRYQINLEIFNRWGNRIYRSVNYKNEWNGKTTEGIRVGDDVPTGTYYYVIKIDGVNKYVGHLTLSR
ncbi:gliding motility-associated-like protein [Pedobacter sp. CAN_A7]|uniref:T9SS type B sorting domain-containing protein n=1 Tax=Pedobacter sp. CAN_A7 TaxID=2787722 RepID=UPI0018C9188E